MNNTFFAWPSNYIAYSYANFDKNSPNNNALRKLYNKKSVTLAQQQAVANSRNENLVKRTGAGTKDPLYELLLNIVSDQNYMSKFLSSAEELPNISSQREVAFFGATTAGQLPKQIIAHADEILADWSVHSNQLINIFLGIFNDILSELGLKEGFQQNALLKWAVGQTLTLDEKKVIADLRGEMKAVQVEPKAQNKIDIALTQMGRYINQLATLSQGAAPGTVQGRDNLEGLAQGFRRAVFEINTPVSEATNLLGSIDRMAKYELDLDSKVRLHLQTKGVGGLLNTKYSPSSEATERLKEFRASYGTVRTVQGKADNLFTFSSDNASVTIGASVKRYSYFSLTQFGLSLAKSNLFLLMDKAGIFDDSGLLNAIMNTAAGNPEDDALAAMRWRDIIDIVAINGLLFALTGANIKNTSSSNILLIVNNKPYLMSTIIEAVSKALTGPTANISNMIGGFSGIGRLRYSGLNNFIGEIDSPNIGAAIERSNKTGSALMQAWVNQKIDIKLRGDILRVLGIL